MGVELVEGKDLVVDNNFVFMKTATGLQKVDVIYRRVNDDYLDPTVWIKDSTLGLPGVIKTWKEKMDDVASPPQLREVISDIEELKMFKTKAVTIFAVVQFAMGVILFALNFID